MLARPIPRRHMVGAVVALTAAAVAMSTGTAAAATCQPAGSTLLKSNSKATVYKVRSGSKDRYYGCLRSTGRQTRLATVNSTTTLAALRLRGHFAALSDGFFVKAVNLTNGKHLKPAAYGQVVNLVVSRNGRLAWIYFYHYQQISWSSFSNSNANYVDSDTCPYTIGNPDPTCINYRSLRLTGKHHDREITWKHGGTTKHFVIP